VETVREAQLRQTVVFSTSSECASRRQQVHAGSETSLQQNLLVLYWGYWLTQVVPYSGRKKVIVVISE